MKMFLSCRTTTAILHINTIAKLPKLYQFKSYINNLHPVKYEDMYSLISEVLNRLIPALNLCLSRLSGGPHVRMKIPLQSERDMYEVNYSKKLSADNIVNSSNLDLYEQIKGTKKYHINKFPSVYTHDPLVNYGYDLRETFPDLKVIIKLQNIDLQKSNPKYQGSEWHVNGKINEDIVATILYTYDTKNITPSKIFFRNAYNHLEYEQCDAYGLKHFFVVSDVDFLIKNLGFVNINENKVIVFPNMLQHKDDSFELRDKKKPGFRKTLVIHLVDPNYDCVLSTTDVPPQQLSWWQDRTSLAASVGLGKYTREEIKRVKYKQGDVEKERLNIVTELVTKTPKSKTRLLVSVEQFKEWFIKRRTQPVQIQKMINWPCTLEKATSLRDDLQNERDSLTNNGHGKIIDPYKASFKFYEDF